MNHRLQESRIAAGLSPAQMDMQLGLPRGTVAGWEAGNGPSEEQVQAVCKLLELSEQWLRTGISEATEADVAEVNRILRGVRDRDGGLRKLLLSHYRKAL